MLTTRSRRDHRTVEAGDPRGRDEHSPHEEDSDGRSSRLPGPRSHHSRPNPAEAHIRDSATTVWAAAIPLVRACTGTSRPARAAMTPSVAA